MKSLLLLLLLIVATWASKSENLGQTVPPPLVLWHGMGDSCCNPLSLGKLSKFIETQLPGVYIHSIEIGKDAEADVYHSFIGKVDEQIDEVCAKLRNDPKLRNGFNALGFSQGGQFLRGVVQRCGLPMRVLVSFGGQHQGVFGMPKCPGVNKTLCEWVRKVLSKGAYMKTAQDNIVQAQYWKDPLHLDQYIRRSAFIADINNERSAKNATYKQNLISLAKLVLVEFTRDTMVVPRESQWFGYYKDGQDKIIIPYNETALYKEDWIGLRTLDELGKVQFMSVDGDHLQFTEAWFAKYIVPLLL